MLARLAELRTLVLISALAAACGPSGQVPVDLEAISTAEQEIIGGTLDSGDMAVVALAVSSGGGYATFCTGTLIAPQTILTAAHCVHAYGTSGTYYAAFGADGYQPQFSRQIVQQIKHPSYTSQGTYDIAVLKLASPITTVTPIPINTTALGTTHLGKDVRHVGFGVYGFVSGQPQSDGRKRQVTTPLRELQSILIESGATGKQTCQGDSGGPGFMITAGHPTERVAGVVAFGDPACAKDGWDTRVDAFATWIQDTYNQWEQPQCTEDGRCASGCPSVDIDCVCKADGLCTTQCPDLRKDVDCPKDCVGGDVCSLANCPAPDPDCKAEGAICAVPTDCKARRCVTDPQHTEYYCSRDCTTTAECPSGMDCNAGQCRFIQLPAILPYAACVPGKSYCTSGTLCVGPAIGQPTTCQYPCSPNGTCFLAGASCVTSYDGRKYCDDPGARPSTPSSSRKTLPLAKAEGPVAAGCSSSGGELAMMGLLFLMPFVFRRRIV